MRYIVITVILVGLWMVSSLYFLGQIPNEGMFKFLGALSLSKTTAELGDSFGLLNGLFSSLAVVIALIAIIIQGKELRESTRAQSQQAEALTIQLKHQETSNRLAALSVKLQFTMSEVARMDSIINNSKGKAGNQDLFNNCVSRKKTLIKESNSISDEISKLLKNV